MMIWLGYALLGAVAGVFSGLLGIGGAILMIPALVYIFKFSQQQAQGTSIATLLLPIGLLAAWKYYSAGHVNVKAAALMAGGFFFGGLLGAVLAGKIPGVWLQRSFGFFLLIIAVKMILVK
ncbi:sulfite exporter TauE/SafE family protein [candidate division TA06 bacterium]|nr:sulfite exporter TauE/SafE family protein [candidate division TA06 bacterium]